MLKFIIFCTLLTTACAYRRGFGHSHGTYIHAAASSDDGHSAVLSAASDVHPDGFDYHVETSDGASSQASGDDSGRIQGHFQWISPEGEHVSLSYVADENGYRPTGAHLPTPPPIPDAILKSLEYNKRHPHEEEADEHHLYHEDHHQGHHLYHQIEHHPDHHQEDYHQDHHLYHQHLHGQHHFHHSKRGF